MYQFDRKKRRKGIPAKQLQQQQGPEFIRFFLTVRISINIRFSTNFKNQQIRILKNVTILVLTKL
ncbi:hypothetical protein DERP_010168 [Dermatophagoides pteronyssinus]|uniref:Uncharacterized protein n=1 Tax=Dermatophagoides pteronyssinus TaxID=6956 RepID=A0ABQ8J7G9_DERPT|nr:hypothetical protein DERP_010168 [Dermatophagoides pteronyssinus]